MRIFNAGWQKIIKARIPRQMMQHKIFKQRDGPQICMHLTQRRRREREGMVSQDNETDVLCVGERERETNM
jgi:hypothetical protein